MSTGYLAKEFRAANALVALGSFVAGGVALSALYAITGLGVPCPFRALTGWDCPLCGGTRMGSSLLHLDIGAAFGYNPVALIGLVVVASLGLLWTVEVLGGPRVRPPAALGQRLRRVHPTRWLLLGLTAAAAYTLVRNLL
ncbi:MAG: hypothetical protein JWN06_1892 [Propionibacteriaceae bacterium]|nr:hypothetical protein [Propionibacteriaceae bacterium]